MANELKMYQEIKDGILCRVYYRKIMGGRYIKVYTPFNKGVEYIKDESELPKICEKLFKIGYFQGHHVDIYTDKVTLSVLSRSIVYWLSRTGMVNETSNKLVKEVTINDYIFPLLTKCQCSEKTKERVMIELDKYLRGDIELKDLLMYFSRRIIKLKKGLTIRKIKIA